MAKKQGVSYSPNTALIQGAGVAYKNYDNVAGMYEGIDKVIKTGTDMTNEAIKKQDAEKLKAEIEAKAAEKKVEAQEKAWRDATQDVYNSAGGFKSQTDYDFTFGKLEKIKGDLIKAQDSGDQKAIAAANIALNEEKAYIDDMVALRNQFSKMDKSSAMSATKNPYDGNNGKELEIVTAWLEEKYEVVENEEGKREFIIESGNKTYSLTKEELEDMYIPTDPSVGTKYFEIRDKFAGTKRFDRKRVESMVKGNLPTDTKGLRAFVADPIGNETFSEMLDNDKSVREEIDAIFDTDKSTPGIDDTEFKMFKEAVVDPYHSFWKDENGNADMSKWEKYCRPIVIEKLSNAIENQHTLNFPEEAVNKNVTEVPDDLPPESYDYDGDNIGEGGPMKPGEGSAFTFDPKFI